MEARGEAVFYLACGLSIEMAGAWPFITYKNVCVHVRCSDHDGNGVYLSLSEGTVQEWSGTFYMTQACTLTWLLQWLFLAYSLWRTWLGRTSATKETLRHLLYQWGPDLVDDASWGLKCCCDSLLNHSYKIFYEQGFDFRSGESMMASWNQMEEERVGHLREGEKREREFCLWWTEIVIMEEEGRRLTCFDYHW